MSAADERVAELLDRWLASVELHVRYLDLDDAAYANVQDWPKHQRPSRWVIELARTRLLELKRLVDARPSHVDAGFAEALEAMSFLTTLLGSEHVERFIPLAHPPSQTEAGAQATSAPAAQARPTRATATPPRRHASKSQPARATEESAPAASDKATATVIADAVRMISWGREWPQLAGLIARMADRPPEPEVLKILRRHRAEIEALARRPRD